MLSIFYGNTGTGKSYAMMERIRERAQEGKRVLVIVPDQFTFEYERMLYGHLGCKLYNRGNTDVLSFSRLTRDIFDKSGAPDGIPADAAAKTAVLYMTVKDAVRENRFVYYKRQAKSPRFISTASTVINELIHSGITPERLAEITKDDSDIPDGKLADILSFYTEYTAALASSGLRDTLFDMQLAAAAAARTGYFDGFYIFMDEFKSFTGDQYDMIRAMLPSCAELTVCMTADSAAAGGSPFASAKETCGYLTAAARDTGVPTKRMIFTENRRSRCDCLKALPDALTRIPVPVYEREAGEITLVKAPDIYAECSYICAQITELVSTGKYRFGDIAVLDGSMNEDISVLAAHFDRYGIPYYSDKKPAVSHKPLILMITSALELASAERISTETLLRYAKTGLSGVSDEDICTLENFCYEWDIDGDMWEMEFPARKDEEKNESGTGICEDIKNRLLAPIYSFKSACDCRSGSDICAAVRRLLAETGAWELTQGGDEELLAANAEEIAAMRENRRLCEETDGILSALEGAFIRMGQREISLSDFKDMFMLCAAGITLASPPVSLDSVAAQQSDLARLNKPKAVFIMHANDGVFPKVPGKSTTFSEAERELFKKAGSDLSGDMKKRLADERFNAFKAVCAPSELLYVSYHTADSRGSTLYPSEYIEKLKKAFPNCRTVDTSKLGLLFYCRTEQAAYAAAVEGYDPSDPEFVTVKRLLEKDPLYRSRFAYLDRVGSGASPEHRISDKRIIERLYGGKTLNISASRLDDYSSCPFKYYCITGLKISPLLKNGLTAMNWGNAVHACMREVLETFKERGFSGLYRSEIARAVTKAAKRYVLSEMAGSFGKKASFPVYLRIMKDNAVRALLRLGEEMSGSRFVPDAFELSIGRPPAGSDRKFAERITIDCPDGHSLNFYGTADRVDLYENGRKKYIRIIDYKTGRKKISLEQLENGINLQMFLYLFSLTDDKKGLYKDCEPAGALYVPVREPLLDADRNADSEEIAAGVDDLLRMSGGLLASEEIIGAMEAIPPGKKGRFIPVERDTEGNVIKSEALLEREELDHIKEMSEMIMRDMCREVYDGNLPASPIKIAAKKSSCDLCDYRSICVNYPDIVPREMKKTRVGKKGKD